MRSMWLLMVAACGTEYVEEDTPFVCPGPSGGMKVVQRLTPINGEDGYHLPHPACPGDLLVMTDGTSIPTIMHLLGGEQSIQGSTHAWELANVTEPVGLDQSTLGGNLSSNDHLDGGTLVTTAFREIAIATLYGYSADEVEILAPFEHAYSTGPFRAAIAVIQDQSAEVTATWARSSTDPLSFQAHLWTLKTY